MIGERFEFAAILRHPEFRVFFGTNFALSKTLYRYVPEWAIERSNGGRRQE
jgi:hypothetical protein